MKWIVELPFIVSGDGCRYEGGIRFQVEADSAIAAQKIITDRLAFVLGFAENPPPKLKCPRCGCQFLEYSRNGFKVTCYMPHDVIDILQAERKRGNPHVEDGERRFWHPHQSKRTDS